MALVVAHLGDDLDFLPDGETGSRRNWIIGMVESLRDQPALELTRDGDWSDYDKTPRFRLRRGRRLAELDLGIVAAAREALPVHARLAGGAGFQVGIPGDVDLAMFVFGPAGPVRHRKPFTDALAATMRQIHELVGDDVLFQIEIPVELVLLARAPRPARPLLAGLLARRVAALAGAAPTGARFGVHLCLGDMNHRALGRLADASPLVPLANALVARWPAGRPLVYVHGPLAAADNPPVDDAAFYRPLGRLWLGGARFIAGYAHEDQDLATQRRIRGHIEEALGRRADVATSCGLGRRDRAAAVEALERVKALLDD